MRVLVNKEGLKTEIFVVAVERTTGFPSGWYGKSNSNESSGKEQVSMIGVEINNSSKEPEGISCSRHRARGNKAGKYCPQPFSSPLL